MKILLKLWKKSGKVKRYVSEKKRRIFHFIGTDNWEKAYIRVNYGYGTNGFAQPTLFHNDGTYFNKKDLIWAINAFTEK